MNFEYFKKRNMLFFIMVAILAVAIIPASYADSFYAQIIFGNGNYNDCSQGNFMQRGICYLQSPIKLPMGASQEKTTILILFATFAFVFAIFYKVLEFIPLFNKGGSNDVNRGPLIVSSIGLTILLLFTVPIINWITNMLYAYGVIAIIVVSIIIALAFYRSLRHSASITNYANAKDRKADAASFKLNKEAKKSEFDDKKELKDIKIENRMISDVDKDIKKINNVVLSDEHAAKEIIRILGTLNAQRGITPNQKLEYVKNAMLQANTVLKYESTINNVKRDVTTYINRMRGIMANMTKFMKKGNNANGLLEQSIKNSNRFKKLNDSKVEKEVIEDAKKLNSILITQENEMKGIENDYNNLSQYIRDESQLAHALGQYINNLYKNPSDHASINAGIQTAQKIIEADKRINEFKTKIYTMLDQYNKSLVKFQNKEIANFALDKGLKI